MRGFHTHGARAGFRGGPLLLGGNREFEGRRAGVPRPWCAGARHASPLRGGGLPIDDRWAKLTRVVNPTPNVKPNPNHDGEYSMIRIRAALTISAALLLVSVSQTVSQTPPPSLSTFSIVACDPENGFLGGAVQSRVVGAGSIVLAAEADIGAVASQAAANVTYKRRALELLRQGRSVEAIRSEFNTTDSLAERRQFAVIDADCRVAAFTGEANNDWAGHRVGEHYSAQGNILTGPEVVEAMGNAFEEAEAQGLPFGERLLAALKAGQAAGGDSRGRQGAGILIVKRNGGYGGGDDRYADLRVEDHVEPIFELERVYRTWMSVFHPEDHFLPNGSQPVSVPRGRHVCALRDLLARVGYGTPPEEGTFACWMDENVIGPLKEFQRDNGLREVPALNAETAARLRELVGRGNDR